MPLFCQENRQENANTVNVPAKNPKLRRLIGGPLGKYAHSVVSQGMEKVDNGYAKTRDAQTVEKKAADKAGREKAEKNSEEKNRHGAEFDNRMKEEKVFLRQNQQCDYGRKDYQTMMSHLHRGILPL